MVHAKQFETVSAFVKVMQRKLWTLFSGHCVDLLVQNNISEAYSLS